LAASFPEGFFSSGGHQALFSFLREKGVEAFIVGGALRDLFLGRPVREVDLALKEAGEVSKEFADRAGGAFVPLDCDFGLYRVVAGENHYDFSLMQGGIRQDLARRDFTINAMALPLRGGELVDPFGGLDDLRARILRATSREVFFEDPVRLLRGVRLAKSLGFMLESSTLSWMTEAAPEISGTSPERIRDEWFRILEQDESWESILLMEELGLLRHVIPEMEELKGVVQNDYHSMPVWEHSVASVRETERLMAGLELFGEHAPALREYCAKEVSGGRSRRSLMKMAALLHDVGKPLTRRVEDGKIMFLGHDRVGSEIGDLIGAALRLSVRESRILHAVIRHHLRPIFLGKEEEPTARSVYRFFRDTGEAAVDTLMVSWADVEAGRGPALKEHLISRHHDFVRNRIADYFSGSPTARPPRLLGGKEVMDLLRLNPGPQVGRILRKVEQAAAEGIIVTPEEAVDYIRTKWGQVLQYDIFKDETDDTIAAD
jgi:putative nucleotidyltransferase with HDIG domain